MVSDALQDLLRDPEKRSLLKRRGEVSEDINSRVLENYFRIVDINLVRTGMCFRPAKSVEFGKTDQSMLNHIRNGVFFLLRFNDALKRLGVRALDEAGLRECIALFVVHDLHKLDYGEMDEDSQKNSMENEFDIPEDVVKKYVEEMHLSEFARELRDDDYYSVAVALHKSRFSRPGARTSRFMDLEPFLYLMDTMASCSSPEEAASPRALRALRDGFPQDAAEKQLNLQYHRLDDVKGILTGLLNKSIAEVLEESGLVMLMTYQDGCVYLGKGNRRASISDELVERIYHRLEKNIQDSTPALSEVGSIVKNVDVQGNLNCYRLDDKYYFFSGPDRVLRAYIEKATVSARSVKTKLSKQMLENIGRALRAADIDVELSDQDGRIVVEYARAIHAVHKIVSEIIKDNTEALAWSCDAWGVTEDVKRRLLSIPSGELTSGGKWEYAYAIARCVMDAESDGVKIKNMEPARAADILFERIWGALKSTEGWDAFISEKTSTYREEIAAYIHETLSVNGTISVSSGSDLSDPYREYQRGGSGRICNLCNSGTLLRQDEMKLPITVSMLKFNFSNRIFAGKTKPDNIYACVPCGVELVLRQNGCEISRRANEDMLYLHMIPDYFFTPESWEIAHSILSMFSGENGVRMAALADKIFKSKYVGGSSDLKTDFYESWIEELASREKSRNMMQYMAQSFDMIGNPCMVFYKPSGNTTEFHFFGTYLALILAAYTGMRVVVSHSPITTVRGRDFREFVALDSVDSHVTGFYKKMIPLSQMEFRIKAASALIRLGYGSKLEDSLFPKYLRVFRDEPLPGSYLLKMVYRDADEGEAKVRNLIDEAIFLDKVKGM
ncbi:MAG: type I-D CRISPR-associated protein Cas10d/Csc3 [Methanothrix sp.]|jgi:hypothetical protein|uniref:type I-D CRISPR-associated protein Cas10d/Csc3 n=1 Tax=Methanothrix sp. TaxID=90426 RepID=UPI0019904AE5|nr:type I-D CRISPR-associated protein Cas10d/Csc3 [Methanothrix sp.]MBC7080257.1 type I-D CRISPR-associated protein Cas10d/Csc3 [Methanothrix sp.]NPU87349.1 type I-D CRISPR-associated protein Cas10d/Csc3 [Methanothrix sp.]